MSVFETLNDKNHSIEARLQIAWRALHNDEIDVRSEDRVAAKCWLTHRVTDGTLPVDQWPHIARVTPPYRNDDGLEVRWRISQLIAECYLHGLRRSHFDDLHLTASFIADEWDNLRKWPSAVLNFMRGMCVLAMRGTTNERASAVNAGMGAWTNVMVSFPWTQHPMRFVELRDDLSALWQLIAIGRQIGIVDYKRFDWLPKFCGGNDPFARLMRVLEAPQL